MSILQIRLTFKDLRYSVPLPKASVVMLGWQPCALGRWRPPATTQLPCGGAPDAVGAWQSHASCKSHCEPQPGAIIYRHPQGYDSKGGKASDDPHAGRLLLLKVSSRAVGWCRLWAWPLLHASNVAVPSPIRLPLLHARNIAFPSHTRLV